VPHHLLAMPGYVAYYHRQPVEHAEVLCRVAVFGAVDDNAAILKVGHPLLRKLAANDLVGKALQGIAVFRRNRLTDMDVEAAGAHEFCMTHLPKYVNAQGVPVLYDTE
jgi:hypothetical protein